MRVCVCAFSFIRYAGDRWDCLFAVPGVFAFESATYDMTGRVCVEAAPAVSGAQLGGELWYIFQRAYFLRHGSGEKSDPCQNADNLICSFSYAYISPN
jgi:hypothetical protein